MCAKCPPLYVTIYYERIKIKKKTVSSRSGEMCPFDYLLVPFYPYFLLSYATSCHSVFIPQFLHHSRSLSCAPVSPKKQQNETSKTPKSVHRVRLMVLFHAETLLLFCLTPAPDEVFWKGRETRGRFLEMPFCWMYLLYTALTTPWTRVISTQHATCKQLDDIEALELHVAANLMSVSLVGLEAKVTCFTSSAYANR